MEVTIAQGETLLLKLPVSTGTLGAMTVTFPGGAQVGTNPGNVTETGVVKQVRSFAASAALAVGEYSLPVSFTLDGVTRTATLALAVTEAGVAYNTDVYTIIRVDLLRVTADALPDAVIDRAFDRVRRELLARFPCIASYEALEGDDALFFDEAAARMAAVVLFPFRHAAGQAGPLTGEATPDFKYTYSADTRDERDAWTDAAAKALGRISCIAAGRRVAASSVSVFAVAGRRRAIERARGAYGCGQGLLGSVLGIYEGWGL